MAAAANKSNKAWWFSLDSMGNINILLFFDALRMGGWAYWEANTSRSKMKNEKSVQKWKMKNEKSNQKWKMKNGRNIFKNEKIKKSKIPLEENTKIQ